MAPLAHHRPDGERGEVFNREPVVAPRLSQLTDIDGGENRDAQDHNQD